MINRFTLVMGAALASLTLLTSTAHAFEQVDPGQALISGFASKHLKTNKFRENNYGIGYRTETGYLAGYYRNSEDRDGFYVGREFHFQVASHVRLGVMAGVVTGYKKRDVMPLLLPEVLQMGAGVHRLCRGQFVPVGLYQLLPAGHHPQEIGCA